jgi:hypothetical protein
MDGFSSYNQINILPMDQHKTDFIFPWGTFAYRKLPFGLKNVGVNFQCAMYYAFHDIKNIVQHYMMIYRHISCIAKITRHIYEPFSYAITIITYN